MSAADRIANTDRTLNSVVSHHNTLHATFSDINSQPSVLTSNPPVNRLASIATYPVDSIGNEIDNIYGPMIARFNSEIVAAIA